MEIFGTYGEIKNIEFPTDRFHNNIGRGFCYVEYMLSDDAENAMKRMDGGFIDGSEVAVAPVTKPHMPMMRRSPMMRGRGPPMRNNNNRWRNDMRNNNNNNRRRSPIRRSPRRRYELLAYIKCKLIFIDNFFQNPQSNSTKTLKSLGVIAQQFSLRKFIDIFLTLYSHCISF